MDSKCGSEHNTSFFIANLPEAAPTAHDRSNAPALSRGGATGESDRRNDRPSGIFFKVSSTENPSQLDIFKWADTRKPIRLYCFFNRMKLLAFTEIPELAREHPRWRRPQSLPINPVFGELENEGHSWDRQISTQCPKADGDGPRPR